MQGEERVDTVSEGYPKGSTSRSSSFWSKSVNKLKMFSFGGWEGGSVSNGTY